MKELSVYGKRCRHKWMRLLRRCAPRNDKKGRKPRRDRRKILRNDGQVYSNSGICYYCEILFL